MTTSVAQKIFADRVNRIEVSATMAVTAEAAKLRAQGINLVDFGAGEPHFATPRHIKDAAIAAIEGNFTRYTAVSGIPELRKAIVERHATDFGSNYTPDEAIFTTGGKLALFEAINVLVDHGDEVVLPVPYWVSFKDIIQFAGGTPVYLETNEAENFRITAAAIEQAITPRTKAIILNSPSNPSGAVIAPKDLEQVVRLAHARGIYVLLDECYAYLQYTGVPISGGSFTDCKEHVIVLGSLSKTYAMTGWRAGFALGPKSIIQAESKHFLHRNICAESGRGRVDWIAAVRGGDAQRLHLVARSGAGQAQRDSWRALHCAGGCLLCVPQHFRVPRQGEGQQCGRTVHAVAA